MSERPTPETDAEWGRLQMLPGGGYSSQVAGIKLAFGMAAWASTLERQRNEARKLALELRDALALSLPHLEAIVAHNEAVNGCESQMDRADLSAVESALTKAKEVLP